MRSPNDSPVMLTAPQHMAQHTRKQGTSFTDKRKLTCGQCRLQRLGGRHRPWTGAALPHHVASPCVQTEGHLPMRLPPAQATMVPHPRWWGQQLQLVRAPLTPSRAPLHDPGHLSLPAIEPLHDVTLHTYDGCQRSLFVTESF